MFQAHLRNAIFWACLPVGIVIFIGSIIAMLVLPPIPTVYVVGLGLGLVVTGAIAGYGDG